MLWCSQIELKNSSECKSSLCFFIFSFNSRRLLILIRNRGEESSRCYLFVMRFSVSIIDRSGNIDRRTLANWRTVSLSYMYVHTRTAFVLITRFRNIQMKDN